MIGGSPADADDDVIIPNLQPQISRLSRPRSSPRDFRRLRPSILAIVVPINSPRRPLPFPSCFPLPSASRPEQLLAGAPQYHHRIPPFSGAVSFPGAHAPSHLHPLVHAHLLSLWFDFFRAGNKRCKLDCIPPASVCTSSPFHHAKQQAVASGLSPVSICVPSSPPQPSPTPCNAAPSATEPQLRRALHLRRGHHPGKVDGPLAIRSDINVCD